MKTVIFICTQNVFRSLSAHYLFEKYLNENQITDFEVDSAGTSAHPWERPYPQTLNKLYELGVDARNHENKQVDQDLVDKADLIICMSEIHREYIKENFSKQSVLFNEIAHGHSTDLQDDVEGEFTILDDFIDGVIEHIHKSIPNLVENINDYID